MKNWKIIHLNSCNSTNEYAKNLNMQGEIADKTAIMTDFQEKGKGQGKNSWQSDKGKNLLCSLFFKTGIKAVNHFSLNIATSLSIIDTLRTLNIESKIKWPNDIYINNHKVAGILIENSLVYDTISSSIVGIGLNVNQDKFPEWIPNPISLKLIENKSFSVEDLLHVLTEQFEAKTELVKSQPESVLFARYLENMYRYKVWSVYRTHEKNFTGRILGVHPDGHLIIETDGGQMLQFDFGEISFLL